MNLIRRRKKSKNWPKQHPQLLHQKTLERRDAVAVSNLYVGANNDDVIDLDNDSDTTDECKKDDKGISTSV